MRPWLLTLIPLAASLGADAPLSPPLSKGFEHFYSLEYDEAIREFEKEIERRPADPEPRNHLAQALLYRELYRAGALESELVTGGNPFLRRAKMEPNAENLKRFDGAIAKAMELAQKRIDQKPDDPDALYAMGVAYGLRGNCGFLIRKTYMDSLKDATSARKLCNRVVEIKPSFTDARMVQGAHDYIVGSLPGYMKFLGFLAGFRGDKEKGIQTLKLVSEKGEQNKLDARILLGVIYRRERRAGDAVPLLRELIERFPRNYLFRLELSQMYADLGDKTNAVAVLNDIDRMKKSKSPGYERITWERLAFARGNLLFWYSDYDAAIASLKVATANPQELDLNSGIMSWMRLGQCYDLKKQRQQAIPAYESAVKLAPSSEVAREARRYLSSPYTRKPRA